MTYGFVVLGPNLPRIRESVNSTLHLALRDTSLVFCDLLRRPRDGARVGEWPHVLGRAGATGSGILWPSMSMSSVVSPSLLPLERSLVARPFAADVER